MARPKPFLSPALAVALALSACAPAPALRPSLGLGAIAAQAGEAQGLLVLDFGAAYALQSLAHLASLRVSLKREGAQDLVRSVDAAALNAGQGRVSFEALSVGPVVVEVEGLDAQGALLGFARGEAAIQAGQTARLPLRLSVGGPATQGGLGVDLAVGDDPASNLVRPLKLTRVMGLPRSPNPTHVSARAVDLQFDAVDGSLWLAMGLLGPTSSNALFHVQPDLQASHSLPNLAGLLAPYPTGGVLLLGGPVDQMSANGRSNIHHIGPQHQLRWFGDTPNGPLLEDQAAAWGGTREGLWAKVGFSPAKLAGPAIPAATAPNLSPWPFTTPRFVLPVAPNDISPGASGIDYDVSTGAERDELIFHDNHQALRLQSAGHMDRLLLAQYFPTGFSDATPLGNLVAQADALAATGTVPGWLRMVAPDHRGGHWALSAFNWRSRLFLVAWRRSPDGRLQRVWGPSLSPDELTLLQGATPTPNAMFGGTTVAEGYGAKEMVEGAWLLSDRLEADGQKAVGATRPGRLAFSNGHGLFVLEEQAASAP